MAKGIQKNNHGTLKTQDTTWLIPYGTTLGAKLNYDYVML